MHVTIATEQDISDLRRAGHLSEDQSFSINRDVTFVCHNRTNQLLGSLCVRPMWYHHSLVIPNSSRRVAGALWGEAEKLARHWGITGTLFQVRRDNEKMIAYCRELGCVVEPDSDLYRYDLLPQR